MSDTRWPETRTRHGIVATPHALASQAGLAMLRGGGNALDAAIAAATAIAVVYPHMTGIGGDSFWLIFDGARRRLLGLNAAGGAAATATLQAYRAHGAEMPARGGAAALTVPGAVSGWLEAHAYSRERLGSPIRWASLLEHAIAYARDGFSVSPGQRRVTAAAADLFGASALPEVRGTLWPIYHPERLAGERFGQQMLATTLARLARSGGEDFYRGDLARRVAVAAAAARSPLIEQDFQRHRAEWTDPIRIRYRDGEAVTLPPPTQGFAALAILALLEGFDVAALDDADYVHIAVEATKLALADRDRWLADPLAVAVPFARCLDAARLARRRERIARRRAMALNGMADGGDTVAIVAADAHGNAVSVIQSLYHEFGTGVVAGDTGVLLQNRGAAFTLDPTHPNCLAPHKRPAHTLIPSMYLVDGVPRLVYGTMGGDGQPQTQAALLTRVLDRGLGPQAAVEAPRWLYGRAWGEPSGALRLESRFAPDVAESLRARGHDVIVVEPWSDLVGHAQLIRVDTNGFSAGSDPRADGAALGC